MPEWWAEWAAYNEALVAASNRASAAQEERDRKARMEKAEAAPTLPLSEIDEAWRRRMLFVMHRRPDAVASR